MIKRLISLLSIVALLAIAAVFISPATMQVGQLATAPQLTVQARDLNLICPGAAINSGGNSGTVNTGGGGSGASSNTVTNRDGGSGGRGIVIVRYKFQ